MKKVSIVVPMYNEEEMAPLFFSETFKIIDKLANYDFEVVVVNDGSKDNTLEILKQQQNKDKRVVIVNLSRNFGHEQALFAGLKSCSGDAIIPMDADLQDPPYLIEEMLKMYEQGYDVVNAKRSSRKKDSFFKKNTAKFFYKFIKKLSKKVKVPENVANFRLISRKALNEVLALKENNRVFRIQVPFVGFKTCEIYFPRPERKKGESKYNIKSMFSLAISSIVSLSTTPLKWCIKWVIGLGIFTIVSSISLLVIFIVGICQSWNLINNLFYVYMLIWLILNIVLFALTTIMVSLSIISIYMSKAVLETEGRPNVIIDEIIKKE